MTIFFNFPRNLPIDHPLRERTRKLFLVRDFREVGTAFEASYVVDFLGSTPTGVLPPRRIFAFDLRYTYPDIPRVSLLIDIHTGMVPMCNLKGRPVVYIPVRQYLQEFLYRDPMANHRL
ncbi:MAG: hypothetical protein RLZZ517_254 [Candidatus Parcubacteria bacterium]